MVMALPLLWSCNDEDDVNEIFDSGTWFVVDYYGKANWKKRTGTPKYNVMANSPDKNTAAEGRNALKIIHTFSLTFRSNGTFVGGMQNGDFKGTWQADGKDRTIRLKIEGNPNTSPAYNRDYIEALQNAVFYQGDSNVIMLAPEDKKTYIQFTHKRE